MSDKINNTDSVKMYLDTSGEYDTVSIQLGKFSLEVSENDRYLTECLNNGYCDFDLPDGAASVMFKHNIFKLTKENNPEIIDLLRKVFVEGNKEQFKDEILKGREVKVLELKLIKDKTVNELLKDRDFQKLNRSTN